MNEFELIQKYFYRPPFAHVTVGIGDDAAIIQVAANEQLAITTDTLLADVHFFADSSAFDIAYKALAVNLSDLAAMGATPKYVTLALTLPTLNELWLQEFSRGFFSLADKYNVQLIGGDITKGKLAITIQALGVLKNNKSLLRCAAKPGDLIYVSGDIGAAGLALYYLKNKINIPGPIQDYILLRLHKPEPRINLGKFLIEHANSAIDISDGFIADLKHILDASKVGATIRINSLPLYAEIKNCVSYQEAIMLGLTAGDDYELCFTIPAEKVQALKQFSADLKLSCVGEINSSNKLVILDAKGDEYHASLLGYQHF